MHTWLPLKKTLRERQYKIYIRSLYKKTLRRRSQEEDMYKIAVEKNTIYNECCHKRKYIQVKMMIQINNIYKRWEY